MFSGCSEPWTRGSCGCPCNIGAAFVWIKKLLCMNEYVNKMNWCCRYYWRDTLFKSSETGRWMIGQGVMTNDWWWSGRLVVLTDEMLLTVPRRLKLRAFDNVAVVLLWAMNLTGFLAVWGSEAIWFPLTHVSWNVDNWWTYNNNKHSTMRFDDLLWWELVTRKWTTTLQLFSVSCKRIL